MFNPNIIVFGLFLSTIQSDYGSFVIGQEEILSDAIMNKKSESYVPTGITEKKLTLSEDSSASLRQPGELSDEKNDEPQNSKNNFDEHEITKDQSIYMKKPKLLRRNFPGDLPSAFESKVVRIIMFMSQKCLKLMSGLDNSELLGVLLLITILTLYLHKLQLIGDKTQTSKYAAFEQKMRDDVNEITRSWSKQIQKKKQALIEDIQKDLDNNFFKIMNEFQELYYEVRKMNSETHQRMHYLLHELKRSTTKIKRNECECLQELEKIKEGITILKNEEELLHHEMMDTKNNLDMLQKTIHEENIFVTRFFQEVFLCIHVQTMIEKNNDPKVRLHYNKIALSNLLLNLQSLTVCNQLL